MNDIKDSAQLLADASMQNAKIIYEKSKAEAEKAVEAAKRAAKILHDIYLEKRGALFSAINAEGKNNGLDSGEFELPSDLELTYLNQYIDDDIVNNRKIDLDVEIAYLIDRKKKIKPVYAGFLATISDAVVSILRSPLAPFGVSLQLVDRYDYSKNLCVDGSELLIGLPFYKSTLHVLIGLLPLLTCLYFVYRYIFGGKSNDVEVEKHDDLPVIPLTALVNASSEEIRSNEEKNNLLEIEKVVSSSSSDTNEVNPNPSDAAVLSNAADNTSFFTASVIAIGSSALCLCFL